MSAELLLESPSPDTNPTAADSTGSVQAKREEPSAHYEHKSGDAQKAQVLTRGEMQLGGSWTLQGPSGEQVTDADLRGSWLLMYFGFTQCPDICPEQLERMRLS